MANQTKIDMTPDKPAATTVAQAAVSAPPPKSVPTITQSVHVDPGSAVSSLVAVFEKYRKPLETAADAAEDFAFSKIPFGSLIESVVGPHLAAQYVDQAINAAEAMAAATGNQVVANPGVILQIAVQAFTKTEGWLSTLGLTTQVEAWVQGALAKVGIS